MNGIHHQIVPIEIQINEAFLDYDPDKIRTLLSEHPTLISTVLAGSTWLHRAARIGDVNLIKFLYNLGADINAIANESYGPPLMAAIHGESVPAVKFLLENGANPNINRALIGAINCNDMRIGLELVKMLVMSGADKNRVFPWFEDQNVVFTPLSWAVANGKDEIADYLRSKGATMPPGQKDPGPPTAADKIVAYFTEKLGPVQPQSQQEIVPTGLPIAIHLVPPSEGRNHITLFTTGMSEQPMTVPQGAEKMRYAELAINLPADWPIPGLNTGKRSLFSLFGKGKTTQAPPGGTLWPFQWLRTIARFPHENDTWLGGPAVIFANGDPPEPLAPGLPFTSFLLMSIDETGLPNGEVAQIYQLLPLYSEERALEIAEGIPALLQALDRHNISWVVDPARPNVGKRRK